MGREREEKKLGCARDSAGPAKREKEERVARLGHWAEGRREWAAGRRKGAGPRVGLSWTGLVWFPLFLFSFLIQTLLKSN
jgi:hypothetical protein